MAITKRQFLLGLASAAVAGIHAREGEAAPEPGDVFDVCVIGSGFAGIPLALQTAAAGLRTVVVEAGVHPWAKRPRFPVEMSGGASYLPNTTRMIAIGGASNHWAGVTNRLRPPDFRLRSSFGLDVDWPISYDDLRPYYCEAERRLAVRGRPPVVGAQPPRSCAYPQAAGEPFAPPVLESMGRRLAFFQVPLSQRGDGPVRLIDEEVPRFQASPTGTLLSGRQVTRLVSATGRRVDHAQLRAAGAPDAPLRARCFVVAAGVIESARLLLLSRSRWFPRGPGNGGDWVGRAFVDHPSLFWSRERNEASAPRASYRSYDPVDPARREKLGGYHYEFDVSSGERAWKVHPEMEPRRENRVTLSGSLRDDLGEPAPALRFDFSRRDLRGMQHAATASGGFLGHLGLDSEQVERHRSWRAHPSGTCRMAFDEAGGVVDRNQKVFGLDNLFVAGACVFPTSGTSNPTLTVVAMSLRLADHLIERFRTDGFGRAT